MLVVGLTGGIGSGKSTVANLFAQKGITIIDTDQLSRDLTAPHQPALKAIVSKLGPTILLANGALNRALLRTLIFNHTDLRAWLEQLLHPLIRHAMQQQIERALSPYCIAVVPLLLETTPNPLIQRILVVDTQPQNQITRTASRDNVSPAEAAAILQTQVDQATRLKLADDIIYNDDSLADLIPQVDKLHQLYLTMSNT